MEEDIEKRYKDEVVNAEVVDDLPAIPSNGKPKKVKDRLPSDAKLLYFANVNLSNQLINKLSPKAIQNLEKLIDNEEPNVQVSAIKLLKDWIASGSPKINYQAIKYMGKDDEDEEVEDKSLENIVGGNEFKEFLKFKMEKDKNGSE